MSKVQWADKPLAEQLKWLADIQEERASEGRPPIVESDGPQFPSRAMAFDFGACLAELEALQAQVKAMQRVDGWLREYPRGREATVFFGTDSFLATLRDDNWAHDVSAVGNPSSDAINAALDEAERRGL